MKTKQLFSSRLAAPTLAAMALFVAAASVHNASFAQVKIGSNPTAITPGANLDVEGVSNRHTVVMQNGFVGVNTVTPQAWLDVRGTTKILPSPGTQTGTIWTGDSNMDGMEVTASNGALYVGIQRGAGAPLHLAKPTGATENSFLICSVGGIGGVGSIRYNGAAGVVYLTTSDQRLKENIHATKFGLEALKTVKVYDYNFKADSKKMLSTGVLAQELHKVYPQAVIVGGADAKANPWQVDYSKLVPMLIKSIQELNEKMQILEKDKAQLSVDLNKRIGQLERMLVTGEQASSLSR